MADSSSAGGTAPVPENRPTAPPEPARPVPASSAAVPAVQVLSWRAYTLGALLTVLVTAAATWWLWEVAGDDPGRRIDAIRTGLTIALGAGGGFALVINARRQWLQERAHNHQAAVDAATRDYQERLHAHQAAVDAAHQAHQLRLAEAAERDAAERRITELYNAAAEQLGSDKAPVRLTALYTLERLANDNPRHRQTIVNIICAYLRMPYTPPPTDRPGPEEEHRERARRNAARYRAARDHRPAPAEPLPHGPDPHEEHQVRLTAQRLLHTHLQPTAEHHWADIDLDLTSTTLTNFTLEGCTLRTADFTNTTFFGHALFGGVSFSGDARFGRASFARTAEFGGASFAGDAWFDGASFSEDAWFNRASFSENAWFHRASFFGPALFSGASFSREAWFGGASFSRPAGFDQASFSGSAVFDRASFSRDARFGEVTFSRDAWFSRASFLDLVSFGRASFFGPAKFAEVRFKAVVELESVMVADPSAAHVPPPGWAIVNFPRDAGHSMLTP